MLNEKKILEIKDLVNLRFTDTDAECLSYFIESIYKGNFQEASMFMDCSKAMDLIDTIISELYCFAKEKTIELKSATKKKVPYTSECTFKSKLIDMTTLYRITCDDEELFSLHYFQNVMELLSIFKDDSNMLAHKVNESSLGTGLLSSNIYSTEYDEKGHLYISKKIDFDGVKYENILRMNILANAHNACKILNSYSR